MHQMIFSYIVILYFYYFSITILAFVIILPCEISMSLEFPTPLPQTLLRRLRDPAVIALMLTFSHDFQALSPAEIRPRIEPMLATPSRDKLSTREPAWFDDKFVAYDALTVLPTMPEALRIDVAVLNNPGGLTARVIMAVRGLGYLPSEDYQRLRRLLSIHLYPPHEKNFTGALSLSHFGPMRQASEQTDALWREDLDRSRLHILSCRLPDLDPNHLSDEPLHLLAALLQPNPDARVKDFLAAHDFATEA